MRAWLPPRAVIVAWAVLLALLTLTVFGAYQPLGVMNTVVALAIATTKALIVFAVFMELRERNALIIAAASAGFFWLVILLWLALADFMTRPNLPPVFRHSAGENNITGLMTWTMLAHCIGRLIEFTESASVKLILAFQ